MLKKTILAVIMSFYGLIIPLSFYSEFVKKDGYGFEGFVAIVLWSIPTLFVATLLVFTFNWLLIKSLNLPAKKFFNLKYYTLFLSILFLSIVGFTTFDFYNGGQFGEVHFFPLLWENYKGFIVFGIVTMVINKFFLGRYFKAKKIA